MTRSPNRPVTAGTHPANLGLVYVDGTTIAVGVDGKISAVGGGVGPEGPPGAAGAAGPQGAAGPALDGEPGEDGAMGPPGAAGADGAAGAPGTPGTTGSQGAAGPALYFLAEDGVEGERGPVGAVGAQGAQGNIGNTGNAGAAGATGPAVYLEAEPGEGGEIGPPGLTGTQGSTGNTGAAGPVGPALYLLAENGEDGERGPPGPQPLTKVRVADWNFTAVATTGTTVETTQRTFSIPADHGLVAGSRIIITGLWGCTTSANNKTFRIKVGATTFLARTETAITTYHRSVVLYLRTLSSQITFSSTLSAGEGGSTAPVTGSDNLTGAFTITLTGQLALASETITLEAAQVRFEIP